MAFPALAAFAAFLVVVLLSVSAVGNFNTEEAARVSFPLVTSLALVAAAATYLGVEYARTRRLDSLRHQLGTRTLALMPAAIALNMVLGAVVANALKVPIYLDSIGTILVGVLCGPLAGAATGFLTNLLWQYAVPPPLQGATAAPFALVAAIIGLLAGVFGGLGAFRPRPERSPTRLALGAAVALATVGVLVATTAGSMTGGFAPFNPDNREPLFAALAWLPLALVVLAAAGCLALLFVYRDLAVAYVVVAGTVTGLFAAVISAPIAATLFGGVTGAGTDFLVVFFRQQGADPLAASLQQSLVSDPIDKVLAYLVAYLILRATSRRTLARFPQGERVLPRTTH